MAEDIYNTAVDFKENLEGYEDIQDVVFYPVEQNRIRLKNTKVYTRDMINLSGIHLDRFYPSGVLDNSSLQLDTLPSEKILHAVVCPKGELIELFNIEEDIDLNDKNVYSPNQLTIAEASWGITVPFEVPSNLGSVNNYAQSHIFEYQPNKMLQSISMKVNNGNETGMLKYIDYGQGWVQITNGTLEIIDNATASYYPNKLRWRIVNTSESELIITRVFIKFNYF